MGFFKALRAVVHRGGDALRKKDADPEVVVETAQEEDFGPGIGAYDICDEMEEAMVSRDDEQKHREQSNRQFLISNGVDVDQFTKGKAEDDADTLLEFLVPDLLGVRASVHNARISISLADPTKTGKVPKNVASASIDDEVTVKRTVSGYDFYDPVDGENLIVRLDYLANGLINKAEVIYWYRHRAMIVRIRTVKKHLRITHIETNTGPDHLWRLVYYDNKAEDPSDATSTVESAFVYVREGVAPNPSPTAPHHGGE